MEQYYGDPRNFEIKDKGVNKNVEVTVSRLNHRDKSDLRNYFQNYSLDPDIGVVEGIELPAGGIEQLVIRRSLQKLVIGTQTIQIQGTNPLEAIPDIGMGDEEEDVDIYEELLKTIVDKNRWLARRPPFAMVFAQYLAAVLDEKYESELATQKKAEDEGRNAPEPDAVPDDGVGPDPLDEGDTSTPTRLSGSELATKVGVKTK
jgi:hypothetical protein